MIQNKINHVTLILDSSSSMWRHNEAVVKVVDSQVAYLARRSKEMDQETRITVYSFNSDVRCIIYDKDVLRMPSARSLYHPGGSTALIDASTQALVEAKEIPQRYGDHSFLFYAITDGEENASHKYSSHALRELLLNAPDNFTIACMVPNQIGVAEAKSHGFPADNIAIWNAEGNFAEVGQELERTSEVFFQARASGQKKVTGLFSLATEKLKPSAVKKSLEQLGPRQYAIYEVKKDATIKDFVEAKTRRNFVKGSAYYELSKAETVQNYKQICVVDKNTGAVFTGPKARTLLNLPDYEVRVSPADHHNFRIYIQSTSVNRKLIAGTSLIVLK